MEFKDILKVQRAALQLTLEDVARYVGVSGATVSRWENGDIENIRRDKIAKLAEILQVTPAYLMGWEDRNGTTDIGLSAIGIAKLAGVSLEVAEAAIDAVSPSSITSDVLEKICAEIEKHQSKAQTDLKVLARHLDRIPEDTRNRLIQNFSDTIDTYFDAMGILREDEQ